MKLGHQFVWISYEVQPSNYQPAVSIRLWCIRASDSEHVPNMGLCCKVQHNSCAISANPACSEAGSDPKGETPYSYPFIIWSHPTDCKQEQQWGQASAPAEFNSRSKIPVPFTRALKAFHDFGNTYIFHCSESNSPPVCKCGRLSPPNNWLWPLKGSSDCWGQAGKDSSRLSVLDSLWIIQQPSLHSSWSFESNGLS